MLAALATGCGAPREVFLRTAWPPDQAAVVVVVDLLGARLFPEPSLVPAGERLRLEVPGTGPFRVLVATYPETPELLGCGVRIGGEGDPLPPALGRWTSAPIEAQGAPAPSFEPDPSPVALDLRRRCAPEVNCPGVEVVTLHAGPTPGALTSVLALSADEALFGGAARLPADRAAVHGRVVGEQVMIAPPRRGLLDDEVRHLVAADGGRAWALTPTQVTALDPRGVPTASIAVGSSLAVQLAVERDTGRLLFSNLRGALLTYDARTSTVVAVAGAPSELRTFAALRSDRALAVGKNAAVDVYDGERWRREVEPSESQLDIAILGEDVMMVAPRLGFLLLRVEATRTWRALDRPFDPFPRAGAAAGGGRVILVGEAGSIGMWTGARWCRIDSGTDRRLWAVSVSPDRRRAFVVGENEREGGEPAFLRLELPAP